MLPQPLVEVAVLELGVAAQHLGRLELAVGVTGQFVVHLLLVALGQHLDFFLALPSQEGADGGEGCIDHVLHEVVALDEEVGVVFPQAEFGEFLLQGSEFAFGILHVLLQPGEFAVHLPAHPFEGIDGLVDVELLDGHDVVEVGEGKVVETSLAMEPDEPNEEFVDDFGILPQVFLEVEEVAVIEGCHHTDVVERGCVALETLDGVGVGVDDVGVVEHAGRGRCVALQQVVEVGIDAGNHVAAQRLAQLVHHGGFLASVEVGARGEHHLEGRLLILKLAEHRAPEEDVFVAFHVGDNLPFLRLRTEAVGCLDVGGGEVGQQMTSHES